MVKIEDFRKLALSFKEVTEQPHFEKTSFRVGKKIFATLDEQKQQAVLKFNEIDQAAFCAFDKTILYQVNGAWGKKGWTIVELSKVKMEMLKDAVTTAYCTVAPTKLSK